MGKKTDAKRISRQEWEIDYVRKIAKELMKEEPQNGDLSLGIGLQQYKRSKVRRVAKALLKLTK